MTSDNPRGFTILELLIAMGLMSLVLYLAIWIFQGASDMVGRGSAQGQIEAQLRHTWELLERDLHSIVSLSSGEQEFMITADWTENPDYGADGTDFPTSLFHKDILSFKAVTQWTDPATYDPTTGTYSVMYVMDDDYLNAANPPAETGPNPALWRYVSCDDSTENLNGVNRQWICEGVVSFHVEYLYTTIDTSVSPYRQISNFCPLVDPGDSAGSRYEKSGWDADAAGIGGGNSGGGLIRAVTSVYPNFNSGADFDLNETPYDLSKGFHLRSFSPNLIDPNTLPNEPIDTVNTWNVPLPSALRITLKVKDETGRHLKTDSKVIQIPIGQ